MFVPPKQLTLLSVYRQSVSDSVSEWLGTAWLETFREELVAFAFCCFRSCSLRSEFDALPLVMVVPPPTICPLARLKTTYLPGESAESSMTRRLAASRSHAASTQVRAPNASRLKMSYFGSVIKVRFLYTRLRLWRCLPIR